MKKIIIEQGNEFKIYDRKTNINEDIFREEYQKANEIKDSLIYYSNVTNNTHQGNHVWEHLNNIIAFCGERGQGKSSAMIQFTYSLKEDPGMEVLDTIDPTAMETVHDILDIVISRMFERYRQDKKHMHQNTSPLHEKRVINLDHDQSLKMSALFQKVHKNLAVLKNSENFIKDEYVYNGSIQNLADIADSMKLRHDVQTLIKEYLKYRDKKILVICLDDLDLNISAAYKMMEQIRKYLILPELIIVMAINMKQLTLCVERQFLLDMGGLERSSRWDINLEAKNMANKYIEKLIPLTRRITLPDIRTIANDGTSAVEICYQNGNQTIFNSNELGIEKGLIRMLYKKTGLVLVVKEDEVHPLIPNTLRELVNMVSVIGSMKDQDQIRNLELFEDYLFDSWAESHLEEKELRWFTSLRERGGGDVQYIVFEYLYNWLIDNKIMDSKSSVNVRKRSIQARYAAIQNGRGKPNNGDILNCIYLCYRGREYKFNFLIFAITTYLSVLMLKLNQDHAKEKLQEFIGESIFGSWQLMRKETGDNKNKSRIYYEYDVAEYWKKSPQQMQNVKADVIMGIDNIKVSAIKDYFNQFDNGIEFLKERLYIMGSVSDFKWTKDSASKGMVSDNNTVASKAHFSFNNLFIRQLNCKSVFININGEKWGLKGVQDLERNVPVYWKQFGELCNILVCNIELLFNIIQSLSANRSIKENTNNQIRAYYNHFFKCFMEAMMKYDEYIGFELEWMMNQNTEEVYMSLVEDLVCFWESTEPSLIDDNPDLAFEPLDILSSFEDYKPVRKLKASMAINDMPSFVRKDSTIQNFQNKLEKLIYYYEHKKDQYNVITQSFVDLEFEMLNNNLQAYKKTRAVSDKINASFSEPYNKIRQDLISSKG